MNWGSVRLTREFDAWLSGRYGGFMLCRTNRELGSWFRGFAARCAA